MAEPTQGGVVQKTQRMPSAAQSPDQPQSIHRSRRHNHRRHLVAEQMPQPQKTICCVNRMPQPQRHSVAEQMPQPQRHPLRSRRCNHRSPYSRRREHTAATETHVASQQTLTRRTPGTAAWVMSAQKDLDRNTPPTPEAN